MSIASVITGGFGQSVALIITDGYNIGAAIIADAIRPAGGYQLPEHRVKTRKQVREERERLGIIPKQAIKAIEKKAAIAIKSAPSQDINYIKAWLAQQEIEAQLQDQLRQELESRRIEWKKTYAEAFNLETQRILREMEAARQARIEREQQDRETEAILFMMLDM